MPRELGTFHVPVKPSAGTETIGELWTDASSSQNILRYSDGATYQVGLLKTSQLTTAFTSSGTALQATGLALSLPPGRWYLRCSGIITNGSATAITNRLVQTAGTLGSTNYWESLLSSAGGLAQTFNLTSFGTDVTLSSTATSFKFEIEGVVVVTATFTLGLSCTKATSGTQTYNVGSYMRAEKWA